MLSRTSESGITFKGAASEGQKQGDFKTEYKKGESSRAAATYQYSKPCCYLFKSSKEEGKPQTRKITQYRIAALGPHSVKANTATIDPESTDSRKDQRDPEKRLLSFQERRACTFQNLQMIITISHHNQSLIAYHSRATS
jgi:hypothetical protein